jgi:hypothetical protein
VLAVGDDGGDGDRQGAPDLAQQGGQVLLPGGQQAAGQQDLARQAIAQHPEHLVADVGLQAIDGQDDPALFRQQALEPGVAGQGDGQQLVVAAQQVADGALGDGQAAAREAAVDLGGGAVLGVAQGAVRATTSRPNSCRGGASAPSASGR